MCCILTCCGWMIDLLQRLWTFAMSCCISSAIACSIGLAGMSGVSLGYNYSLAEYIELKETNVSVYLKRGVFDDETVEEMDWRRSGGGGAGRSGKDLMETPVPTGPPYPFGGRRADDEGIFATTNAYQPNVLRGQDDDTHRFEGSLLKLTAGPQVGEDNAANDMQLAKVATSYPEGSVDQLKALQGLLNRRNMEGSVNPGQFVSTYKPIFFTFEMTGTVPYDTSGANRFSSSSGSDVPEEMQLIQKLLSGKKAEAMKQFADRQTKTVSTPDRSAMESIPFIGGLAGLNQPGRRMMDQGYADPNKVASSIQELPNPSNDASKWYQPRPTPTPSVLEQLQLVRTEPRTPIVLVRTPTTIGRILVENTFPPQNAFRKAMQDSFPGNVKFAEPQNDYDENDIKGFPVRKKKKRSKRDIDLLPRSKTTLNSKPSDDIRGVTYNESGDIMISKEKFRNHNTADDKIVGYVNAEPRNERNQQYEIQKNNDLEFHTTTEVNVTNTDPTDKKIEGNNFFNNMVTILENLKLNFATEDSTNIKPKNFSEYSSTTNIVSSPYVNLESSSTEFLILKLMKSTKVS